MPVCEGKGVYAWDFVRWDGRRWMPLRSESWHVPPGELDLIAMPLVLPWYPAKDERLAASLFRLRDVGRLAAVSKALRRAVKYHDLLFKALPERVEWEAGARHRTPGTSTGPAHGPGIR